MQDKEARDEAHDYTSSPLGRAHSGPLSSTNRRPAVNLTRAERIGRILFGTAALTTAALLLISAGSALASVLELLLVAAGLELAMTGEIGPCRFTRGSATCRHPYGGPNDGAPGFMSSARPTNIRQGSQRTARGHSWLADDGLLHPDGRARRHRNGWGRRYRASRPQSTTTP
jgi:hypothetical protein